MRYNSRAKKGFTLIELLVVVAIVMILASMLLPALAKGRAKARQINCISHMKQWGTVFQMYADDYAGQVVINQDVGPAIPGGVSSGFWWHQNMFYARYFGNRGQVTDGIQGLIRKLKMCPAVDHWDNAGVNTTPSYTMYRPQNPTPNYRGFNLKHVSYPNNFIIMSDAVPASTLAYVGAMGNGVIDTWAGCRHFGGANVLFGDFHVEWRQRADIEKNLPVWTELNGIVGDIVPGGSPWFP